MNNTAAGSSSSPLASIWLSPLIYHPLRLFIGGLFLYAGMTKLADTAGFGQSIAAYGILPAILIPCAAFGLPALEVAAGFGALLNRRWGILGILALTVLFLGVLGYGVAAGLQIDCGCFSTGEKAPAAREEAAPLLEIPDQGGTLLDDPVALIEPVQPAEEEGACSEEEAAGSSLRDALIRDIFFFLGTLYLVAWPDWRRRKFGQAP